ncbi:hypothetical protein FQN60_001165, partial [Etheostoma spectabile]
FVRNLSSSKEGWIAAANLITLIEKSKSCQSLTSSVALDTSALRPAAVRPTQASLTSNPELITSAITKRPLRMLASCGYPCYIAN